MAVDHIGIPEEHGEKDERAGETKEYKMLHGCLGEKKKKWMLVGIKSKQSPQKNWRLYGPTFHAKKFSGGNYICQAVVR